MFANSGTVANYSSVRDEVSCALLTAANHEEVAREFGRRGHDEAMILNIAKEITSSAPFVLARRHWVRLRCREWMCRIRADLLMQSGTAGRIDQVEPDLSRDEFLRKYYYQNNAALLGPCAAAWPAVSKWTKDYLIEQCGDVPVDVMMNRSEATVAMQYSSAKLVRQMPMSAFVDLVYSGRRTNDYYMVARNRFFEKAGSRALWEDIGDLPFVDTRASADGVRMWFGPGGTVTPFHYDDKNIVMIQVVGRKRIRLYPPFAGEAMQQVQPWYAAAEPAPDDPYARLAVSIEMTPGDGLFLPVGWWHEVESEEVSLTLTFLDFGVPNQFAEPLPGVSNAG